jgi:hypothetical protein
MRADWDGVPTLKQVVEIKSRSEKLTSLMNRM